MSADLGIGLRCPNCGEPESWVVDSRTPKSGAFIRRRRECACGHRFTTYERPMTPEQDRARLVDAADLAALLSVCRRIRRQTRRRRTENSA